MTVINKELVQAKWSTKQMQEATAMMAALVQMNAMKVLSKHGEEAVTEFKNAVRAAKVAHIKEQGVKTPLELVKALAEHEVNTFGSKIEISGDDKVASMHYLSCGMWEAMQKVAPEMSKECMDKMSGEMQNCVMSTAKEFNFSKGEVKFEGDKTMTVTYTK